MILSHNNAITGDIIEVLNGATVKAINDTKQFAKEFKGLNCLESAENVWNWVKINIPYLRDPEGKQIIQQPSALVRNKNGGDCKSFSLLIGSLLYNLGCNNVRLRYVSYKNDNIPTHVYCIFTYNGVDIPVDGVIDTFNFENKKNFKIDYKMNVYELSGFTDQMKNDLNYYYKVYQKVNKNTLCSHLLLKKMQELKNQNQVPLILTTKQFEYYTKRLQFHKNYHEKRKHTNICYQLILEEINNLNNNKLVGYIAEDIADNEIGKFSFKDLSLKNLSKEVKKGVQKIKKFALAIPRNAFLGLVAVNALNVGGRIRVANVDKVKDLWENKFGGDFNSLKKAVNNGLKKGFEKNKHKGEMYGIGVIDPATQSLLLAAAPILVAFLKILGGGKQPKLDKDGKPILDKNGNPVTESGGDYIDRLKDAGINVADQYNKLKGAFNVGSDGDIESVKEGVVIVDKENKLPISKILIGAGLLTGILLITKKNKNGTS